MIHALVCGAIWRLAVVALGAIALGPALLSTSAATPAGPAPQPLISDWQFL
jgi:hypothetical protein